MQEESNRMSAIEFQTVIDVPADKVFAYLADLEKHIDWSGGQAIRKTSDGPVAAGSTYETEEQGPFGLTIKERSSVTQRRPNELFAWRSSGPLGTWFDWSF